MVAETDSEVRATALAHGRALKRVNAAAALFCGIAPAVVLGVWHPASPERWLMGLAIGCLWANGFEYFYHRFLLHLPSSFFGRGHLLHHSSITTPVEAEHVNLGGSPFWVAALFVANGVPVVAADLWLRLGLAPGMLVAFSLYTVITEEIHWRIHLGGWLPPGLRSARARHLAHHDRPNTSYNIFLPVFDWFLER